MTRIRLIAKCSRNCDCCNSLKLKFIGSLNKKGKFSNNVTGQWDIDLTSLDPGFKKLKLGKEYIIDIYDATI